MKFYDDYGKTHRTVFGAILGNLSKQAGDLVRSQMPGYEETINENEHRLHAVTAYIGIIRKHWNRAAVLTDVWRRGTNEQEVTEAELLPGELSAVTFQVGCYTVRRARRVYRVYTPGYSPELEVPADQEEVEFYRGANQFFVIAPSFNGQQLRITNEISARHNANPNNGFTYVCRAVQSTSYKWSEQIGAICSAKERNLIPGEYASLLICNTYIGDSFSVDSWYKLAPTGKITKLELHPFDSNTDNARFI